MIFGGASLCLGGLGIVFSGPLGVIAWVMANRDLTKMKTGLVDPAGEHLTRNGRTAGMTGVLLGVLFAALMLLLRLLS